MLLSTVCYATCLLYAERPNIKNLVFINQQFTTTICLLQLVSNHKHPIDSPLPPTNLQIVAMYVNNQILSHHWAHISRAYIITLNYLSIKGCHTCDTAGGGLGLGIGALSDLDASCVPGATGPIRSSSDLKTNYNLNELLTLIKLILSPQNMYNIIYVKIRAIRKEISASSVQGKCYLLFCTMLLCCCFWGDLHMLINHLLKKTSITWFVRFFMNQI